jgi:hypothetical protein
MDIKGYGKATKEMVSQFEDNIGFFLPVDYRNFLLDCNGGVPQIRYALFYVKELNMDIPLHVLLGLGLNKLDLQKRNDEYWDDLLPNCIIIGDDPGSGMIVLINNEKEKGVFYWDHSFYFEQSSEEHNIYKVANSFQEFLEGLRNPELL